MQAKKSVHEHLAEARRELGMSSRYASAWQKMGALGRASALFAAWRKYGGAFNGEQVNQSWQEFEGAERARLIAVMMELRGEYSAALASPVPKGTGVLCSEQAF